MRITDWVEWHTSYDEDPYKDTSWLLKFRIKAFELLLILSCIFLLIIVLRSLLVGEIPIADIGNFLFFLLLLLILKYRPDKFKLLSWLGLVAFLFNMYDGFKLYTPGIINPSYILYPLLVLYGALIGDVWIALVAFLFVFAAYLYAGIIHYPLPKDDFFMLTNLFLLVVASGVSALTIWFQHQRFVKIINYKAHNLQRELDAKLRLNALIFHDIKSPLCVIRNIVDMIKEMPITDKQDIDLLIKMTDRISAIIESARTIEGKGELFLQEIPVSSLFTELQELFAGRLNDKEQTLILDAPDNLSINSNKDILCNSVLGNFISNAIKFSPRKSEIKLSGIKEVDKIRLSVLDCGEGFSDELLYKGAQGKKYPSSFGTEGEFGTAYGLMIASICMRSLNGKVEIRNRSEGGAEVSVVI